MSLSRKIALKIFSKESSLEDVMNLLKKYKMLSLLPSVKKELIQISIANEKKDIISIQTPFDLSPESVAKIKRIIGNDIAGHEVLINKNLLAGFQARFRGKLYDGSAQGIIKKLLTTK
jgi:F0F1-type ATP synthase delta subunit